MTEKFIKTEKTMKRVLVCLLAGVFALSSLLLLGSCGGAKNEKYTRVVLSIDGEIELLLDGKGDVYTVTPLDEHAARLVYEDLVGTDPEWAVDRLVTIAAELGVLTRGVGLSGENVVSISVAGEGRRADKLWKKLTRRAARAMQIAKVAGQVGDLAMPDDDDFRRLIADATPLSAEQVADMDTAQMLCHLASARRQAADISLLSPDLIRIYAATMETALAYARYRAIGDMLEQRGGAESAAYAEAFEAYDRACLSVEEARFRVFGDVASDYRKLVTASDAVVISIIKTRASTENMVYGSEEYNAVMDRLDGLQTDYETADEAVKEKRQSLSFGIHMLNQTRLKKADALDKLIASWEGELATAAAEAIAAVSEQTVLAEATATYMAAYGDIIATYPAYYAGLRADLLAEAK